MVLIHNLNYMFATDDLAAIRQYWSSVHPHIDRLVEDYEAKTRQVAKDRGFNQEETRRFFSFHADHLCDLEASYYDVASSAILMRACSWLESALVMVCRDLDQDAAIPKSMAWDAQSDRGIRKAAAFLKVNFGIKLADHRHWQRLLDVTRVRDCFVHAGGNMELMADASSRHGDQRNKVQQAAVALEGVHIAMDTHLALEDEFFRVLFDALDEFWEDLQGSLQTHDIIGAAWSTLEE